MQTLDLGFISLMTILATIDFKTLRVPIWGLVALIVLIVANGHYAIMDTIYGACIMIASVFLSDYILQRETVGGGDFWLGILMCSFMGFEKFWVAYTMASIFGCISMFTVYRNNRTLDVAYVPYLTAGAFWALFIIK